MRWKIGIFIFVGGVAALWLIKAPIIASYLSDELGLDISLRTVSIRPKQTEISHFRIENPYGFRGRTALAVKTATIDYRWRALPEEIDLITLDTVFLNIDIRGNDPSDNNWAALGAQMPKNQEKQKVVVHKLVIKNLTVKTEGKWAQSLGIAGTQHFDQIELNEIDSEQGFPTKELISQIFHKAGLEILIQKFINPTLKKALNPFRIFGENEKTLGESPEGLKN